MPLVLLAGGTITLSWPDKLCATLARGGRHVVRYDPRDSGASTTVDPRHRPVRCAISPPTGPRSPADSTTARRTKLDTKPSYLGHRDSTRVHPHRRTARDPHRLQHHPARAGLPDPPHPPRAW
jgi:pimeloyl-ACP methyl ester carboxylesterase